MSTVKFSVVSESSGDLYELIAEPTTDGLRFSCNCQAGLLGQFCKHRAAILCGSFPTNPRPSEEDIATFKNWVSSSRVGALLDSVANAEEGVKIAKKHLLMVKHELGRRLHEGAG